MKVLTGLALRSQCTLHLYCQHQCPSPHKVDEASCMRSLEAALYLSLEPHSAGRLLDRRF